MTWFTDNPWPLIFILGFVACAFFALWSSQKKAVWLAGGLLSVIAAAAVYFVEQSIVTERERVEQKVLAMRTAFVRGDRAAVVAYFSAGEPELRRMAESGLDMVKFPAGLDIKDMSVSLSNENTRAVARFRANGDIEVKLMGIHHVATRWDITWQKEGADWKIIDVERLNPIKDEKMAIFEQRAN